jgi:hypothetical protein
MKKSEFQNVDFEEFYPFHLDEGVDSKVEKRKH